MGRFFLFKVVLVLALLVLCSSHGINRKVMATVEFGHSLAPTQETDGNFREMIQVDYNVDPQPNTNPRNGYAYTPSPQG